jgi:lysophospholipase L1-like esterase
VLDRIPVTYRWPVPNHPKVLRFVALGDSYTIGTSVAQEDRWPDQLVARLTAVPQPGATLELVANHAVNGATASAVVREQLPRLDADAPSGFATLLVGVNDVVQGVPEATYGAAVDTILADLLGRLPPHRVLCVETPDYTLTPMGAAFGDPATQCAGIVRNNGILRARCEAAGIRFVDGILAISRDVATDGALVAPDGLHPSGAQYRRWVIERIEPAVRELLGD